MTLLLGEFEQDLAAAVEAAVERHIEPALAPLPVDEPVSAEVLRELNAHAREFGVFGARVPEQHGGSGLSCLGLGVVLERLPPFLAMSAVSQEATTFRIAGAADEGLRERYLPGLIAGTTIAASGISEPGAGSDPRSIATTATPDGDSIRLRGTKLWITNATVADVILVLARHAETGELVRVLVDCAETPLETREVPMSGLRQGHLGEVVIDVEVPAAQLLAGSDGTRDALTRSWLANRPNVGLIACNIAARALAFSIEHVRERRQFGQPIGGFQLVQGVLADVATELDAARLLCYRALAELDQGRRAAREASMAKMFATEMAVRATLRCQELFGSAGSALEYPLDQWLRDARMLTFPDGTRQIHQLVIGRDLTGISAFSAAR
ncbi:MAG TPA: acyl-CoA dehydrogenase family protein [Solirubrobacterales bacterium]|nr:acyl-CoA dehydrogenase family protein [Solirubrobacterales bacterium]